MLVGWEKNSVEWISCRCFLYGYSYFSHPQVQYYLLDSMMIIYEKIPIPILQKTSQSILLGGGVGGSGRGDLKEGSFMFVLLRGGNCHMLALL